MERSREGRGSRTEVPSRYRVRVNPTDLTGLAPDTAAAQELAGRLADAALTFARAHAYHLARRPSVAVVADPSLQRGRVEVDVDARPARDRRSPSEADARADVVETRDGVAGGVASLSPDEPAPDASAPIQDDAVSPEPPAPLDAAPAPDAAAAPAGSDAVQEPARDAEAASERGAPGTKAPTATGIRDDGAQTHVFRRPSPESARAVLRVLGPDGRETSIEVDGRPLTVGRARDNGLVIDDSRVSRHHGRLLARHGALVYADLDSTNGSRVNGVRVDEIALGVGDRILLGDTVLVVESLPS